MESVVLPDPLWGAAKTNPFANEGEHAECEEGVESVIKISN
jgi:hypothetical protein